MSEMKLRNLCPGFGTEVSGGEPHVPLDDAPCRALKTLFDGRSLLVFRDIAIDLKVQTYLSEMLLSFAKYPAAGGYLDGLLVHHFFDPGSLEQG